MLRRIGKVGVVFAEGKRRLLAPSVCRLTNSLQKAGYQANHQMGHKADHKADHKSDHKADHKADHKSDHKAGMAYGVQFNKTALQAVSVDDHQMLVTDWKDRSESLRYPFLWLRDNCQCEQCFHPTSKVRQLVMRGLNVNTKPSNLQICQDEREIKITWDDGHISSYDFDWLMARRFEEDGHAERRKMFSKKPKLWGSEYELKMFDFEKVLTNDREFHAWLVGLEEHGLVFLDNVPKETGQIKRVIDKISFDRPSQYGPYYKVHFKPENISSLAYSTQHLDLHTDLPHALAPPGMFMLHCIIQTPMEGGANLFADGFKIAMQMKNDYPVYYQLLCDIPIDFIGVGTDYYGKFYKMGSHQTISFDEHGELFRICFGHFQRDSFIRASSPEVADLMKALYKFLELCYMSENLVTYKLHPGQIACINNYRLLHGRTGYVAQHNTERLLEGTYADWEELWSRRRVLETELGILPQ